MNRSVVVLLAAGWIACCGCGSVPVNKSPVIDADEIALEAQNAFRQGRVQQGIDLLRTSVDFNRGTDRLPAVAQNLNDLGVMSMVAGDSAAAQRCLQEAFDLYRQMGDPVGQLSVRLNLANLKNRDGTNPAVEKDLRDILAEADALHQQALMASAYNQLAQCLAQQKKYEEAHVLLEKTLPLYRKTGSFFEESICCHNLADMEFKLQRYDEAEQHLTKAIAIDKENQLWQALGDDLFLMGCVREGMQNKEAALNHYERAFYVYRYTSNARGMDTANDAIKRLGGQSPSTDTAGSPAGSKIGR